MEIASIARLQPHTARKQKQIMHLILRKNESICLDTFVQLRRENHKLSCKLYSTT